MVCAALTDVPGSSAALLGGVVSYSDAAKVDLLGVNPGTLRDHGAVSAQTVREMASGAQRALASDLAVSISGVAGPGGGTEDKPIGTVWFGLSREASGAQPALSRVFLRHYGGDRAAIRLRATSFALDLLRRAVLDLSLPE
jgi:PncC family amidohydrolase